MRRGLARYSHASRGVFSGASLGETASAVPTAGWKYLARTRVFFFFEKFRGSNSPKQNLLKNAAIRCAVFELYCLPCPLQAELHRLNKIAARRRGSRRRRIGPSRELS